MALPPPVAPVMVVDDDHDIRELVRILLESEGFTVLTATNGREALDLLDRTSVALLVIDQMMPGLSGSQVVAELRLDPRTATLPVLMLTSLSAADAIVRGLEAGVDDYVTKPFSPDELVARVRARLRGAEAWLARMRAEAVVRADITSVIENAPGTVPDQAAVVCGELVNLPGVSHAAVLALLPSGGGTMVAAAGTEVGGWVGDRVLPAGFHDYLVEHAPRVRWLVAPGEASLPGLLGPPGEAAAVAAAVLVEEDTVVGALLVRAFAPTGDSHDSAVLALDVAGGFGDLLSRLLAPQIRRLTRAHSDRTEIAAVISGHRFFPVFQPVIDLRTSKIVGYEALTRFAEGHSPEDFFEDATRLGLGVSVEQVTAGAAIDAAVGLPAAAWLSVNVAPETVMQPRVLAEAIRRSGREIVLEITERAAIADYEHLGQCLREIGGHVRIAVDDTGSGYASLRHVLEIRPAFVKLDRDWVHGIDTDERRRGVVAGVVHMASQIGTEIIAEGVETSGELRTLRELGVRLAQGYLLGKPEPVD